jgi:hypothetical protein
MEKELITYFLELSSMAPENNWSEKVFNDNPPRLIRYKRLIALITAFNLKMLPTNDGYVLEPLNLNDLSKSDLLTRLSDSNKLCLTNYDPNSTLFELIINQRNEAEIGWNDFLKDLLAMKFHLYQLNTLTEKYLAVSGLYILTTTITHFGIQETNRLNEIIDELLAYIINPNALIVTKEELNSKFGYPLVDLDDIDLDWL